MSTYTDTRKITLSSNHGTSLNGTYLSNILFDFKSILKDDEDIIQTQISLDNAQIPVSFYTINYTNNILAYRSNGVYSTITIPVGNYNFNTLSSKIEVLFNALTIPITITIDKVTGKVTFTKTNSPTSLVFVPVQYSILPILGGLSNTEYTFSSNTLSFPFPMNLLGIKRLSIVSNLLPTHSFSSLGVSNILSTVDVTAPSFGIINFQNATQVKHMLRVKQISNIDIQILDENGNYVNFNNVGWTICITIEILRQLIINTTSFSDVLANQIPQDVSGNIQGLVNDTSGLAEIPDILTEQNLTNQDLPDFEVSEDTDLQLLQL
jgi:hypothetical protein